MSTLTGFESPDKIKKTYSWFDLETKKFSPSKKGGYSGGVPMYYDAETRKLYLDTGDTHSLVGGKDTGGSCLLYAALLPAVRCGYQKRPMKTGMMLPRIRKPS